jgi:hypothetical protein
LNQEEGSGKREEDPSLKFQVSNSKDYIIETFILKKNPLGSKIWDLDFGSWILDLGIWILGLGIWDLGF